MCARENRFWGETFETVGSGEEKETRLSGTIPVLENEMRGEMSSFTRANQKRLCVLVFGIAGLLVAGQASAQLTVTPITWDVVGLDHNRPLTSGPELFPVGAEVCSAAATSPTSPSILSGRTETAILGLRNGSPLHQSPAGIVGLAHLCFDRRRRVRRCLLRAEAEPFGRRL